MKILITGITSMHGWPSYLMLRQRYSDAVLGICSPGMKAKYFADDPCVTECAIDDLAALKAIIEPFEPTHVLHAAGFCDLDVGEAAPDLAYRLNVLGLKHILNICSKVHGLYVSSDLVFSGNQTPKGGYAPEDLPDPISVVGKTYAQAEVLLEGQEHWGCVRIGLPLGPSLKGKSGAIDFLAYRLKNNRPMTLFEDEWRSVICANLLAEGLLELMLREQRGLWHWGGAHNMSLYQIGEQLVRHRGYDPQYLIRSMRHKEKNGPPRIGDVHLNSHKTYDFLGFCPHLLEKSLFS